MFYQVNNNLIKKWTFQGSTDYFSCFRLSKKKDAGFSFVFFTELNITDNLIIKTIRLSYSKY
jgi:hypothetical protein